MKFFRATTKRPWAFEHVMGGKRRHIFPAGTEVSAVNAAGDRWHLNAEHDGEIYDGLMPSSALDIGEVIATVNE